MGHLTSVLHGMTVAILLAGAAVPAEATSITLNQPASSFPTVLNSSDGDMRYTVTGCTYTNTAAANSTTSVAGQSAIVASGTACITALGLQMVQNGLDGMTFSSTTANPLAAVSTSEDFSGTATASIVLNVAITSNGDVVFTNLTGATATGSHSGTGVAGANIAIGGGTTLNPTSSNGNTQNANFTSTSTLNLTITASAYATSGSSGASLTSFSLTPNDVDVPEPTDLSIAGVGVLTLGMLRRRATVRA